MGVTDRPGWRITGATVRGAIHQRRGSANQDAISWLAPERSADCCILAIADGHGAPLHFRSHRGSRFAVRTAITALRRFARSHAAVTEHAASDVTGSGSLARDLVHAWRAQVSADIARRPLSAWEMDEVAAIVQPAAMERLAADPMLAYGSTLLAALFMPAFNLYLQIGDGNILVLDGEDAPAHAPMPGDPRLIGDQTTSLCSAEAWRAMRMVTHPVEPAQPSCVMLSTDGYVNSFESDQGLAQAAIDLCGIAREKGMLDLAISLPAWLRSTSDQGSGDDITVGLAVRFAD